jgi:hypothetical protein
MALLYIESHIRVFPEGQICAEITINQSGRRRTRRKIVASNLILHNK